MDSGPSEPQKQHEGLAVHESLAVSVDCMGGDLGPSIAIAAIFMCADQQPDIRFLAHGDQAVLAPLLARRPELASRIAVVHAERTVSMLDKPSQVMRHGEGTSMWSALEAVKTGQAAAAVSCGNTGALMALSMIRLRKLPGVSRPAIACFWPSRNPSGFNVMLDVGADIKADGHDLLTYALMGTSYARNALGLDRPRVGLLNVGTEEHKGSAELKAAQELLEANSGTGAYDYVGFVEGSDIPSDLVDVIVTDGFTGNIALKTAEGTARLVSDFLRATLRSTLLAKLGYLLARGAFRRLSQRMDPRVVNGGVFLGVNGTVIKSHGGADEKGMASAIGLAIRLSRAGFLERLAARIATATGAVQAAPEQMQQPGHPS